jgi:hypothetical protein
LGIEHFTFPENKVKTINLKYQIKL